jgi:hypothetical protein
LINSSKKDNHSIDIGNLCGGKVPLVIPSPLDTQYGDFKIFQPEEGKHYDILVTLINEDKHSRTIKIR